MCNESGLTEKVFCPVCNSEIRVMEGDFLVVCMGKGIHLRMEISGEHIPISFYSSNVQALGLEELVGRDFYEERVFPVISRFFVDFVGTAHKYEIPKILCNKCGKYVNVPEGATIKECQEGVHLLRREVVFSEKLL